MPDDFGAQQAYNSPGSARNQEEDLRLPPNDRDLSQTLTHFENLLPGNYLEFSRAIFPDGRAFPDAAESTPSLGLPTGGGFPSFSFNTAQPNYSHTNAQGYGTPLLQVPNVTFWENNTPTARLDLPSSIPGVENAGQWMDVTMNYPQGLGLEGTSIDSEFPNTVHHLHHEHHYSDATHYAGMPASFPNPLELLDPLQFELSNGNTINDGSTYWAPPLVVDTNEMPVYPANSQNNPELQPVAFPMDCRERHRVMEAMPFDEGDNQDAGFYAVKDTGTIVTQQTPLQRKGKKRPLETNDNDGVTGPFVRLSYVPGYKMEKIKKRSVIAPKNGQLVDVRSERTQAPKRGRMDEVARQLAKELREAGGVCLRCKVMSLINRKASKCDGQIGGCQNCKDLTAKLNDVFSGLDGHEPYGPICIRSSLFGVWLNLAAKTWHHIPGLVLGLSTATRTELWSSVGAGKERGIEDFPKYIIPTLKTSFELKAITAENPKNNDPPSIVNYIIHFSQSVFKQDILDTPEYLSKVMGSFKGLAKLLDELMQMNGSIKEGILPYCLVWLFRHFGWLVELLRGLLRVSSDPKSGSTANELQEAIDMLENPLKTIWFSVFSDPPPPSFSIDATRCDCCQASVTMPNSRGKCRSCGFRIYFEDSVPSVIGAWNRWSIYPPNARPPSPFATPIPSGSSATASGAHMGVLGNGVSEKTTLALQSIVEVLKDPEVKSELDIKRVGNGLIRFRVPVSKGSSS